MFRFRSEVRGYVKSLAELLYFANAQKSGKWASQSSDPAHNGVFGFAQSTIEAIIREECGEQIVSEIQHSRYGWNFGGSSTFLSDVEHAVQAAYDSILEERTYEAESE